MTEVLMKKCSSKTCDDPYKPVTEFGKNKSRADGLQAYCKPCNRTADRESRERRKNGTRIRKTRKKRPTNIDPGFDWCSYLDHIVPISAMALNKGRATGRSYCCQECRSDENYRRLYGISKREFDAKLASQNGRCAACGTDNPGNGKGNGWVMDHWHGCCSGQKTCGKCLRSVLCSNCNVLLGMAKDSPKILRSAAEYLEKYSTNKETHALAV